MKNLALLIYISIVFVAAAQDGPAVDEKSILDFLQKTKPAETEATRTQASKAIQDLSAAAASPASAIAFFTNAMKAISFAGQPRAQILFMEWKKAEEEHLKNPEMRSAICLHLRYLVLSLQHACGMTVSRSLPTLIAYCDQVASSKQGVQQHDMLQKINIHRSIFTKWYGIEKLLEGFDDWESSPGNVDGIWQKTILPQLRKDKDPRVILYWDNKLKSAAATASKTRRAFDSDQFDNIAKPGLLWSRAEDLIEIGQRNRGLTEMLAIIKGWPNHSERANWRAEMETILTSGSASVGASRK